LEGKGASRGGSNIKCRSWEFSGAEAQKGIKWVTSRVRRGITGGSGQELGRTETVSKHVFQVSVGETTGGGGGSEIREKCTDTTDTIHLSMSTDGVSTGGVLKGVASPEQPPWGRRRQHGARRSNSEWY